MVNALNPIRERYEQLINSKELDDILDEGRDKTLEIAKKKYEELKEIVGLKR